jgi:eukaryotic-like serine/threonine-protein kinase
MIVVALVSALITMSIAIHGREVTVPDLAGQTVADARRLASQKNLQLILDRQFFSASVPEGRIVSQSPSAGSQVRRSWQIRAAESLGPQRIEIPDLTGQSERAADLNLRRRGIELGMVARTDISEMADERVIAQSPPPSARGISSPRISLLFGTPGAPQAFVMPNFAGQPLGSATLALKDAGFHEPKATTIAEASSPISPASIIVSQTPVPGEKVEPGSAIEFQVK